MTAEHDARTTVECALRDQAARRHGDPSGDDRHLADFLQQQRCIVASRARLHVHGIDARHGYDNAMGAFLDAEWPVLRIKPDPSADSTDIFRNLWRASRSVET